MLIIVSASAFSAPGDENTHVPTNYRRLCRYWPHLLIAGGSLAFSAYYLDWFGFNSPNSQLQDALKKQKLELKAEQKVIFMPQIHRDPRGQEHDNRNAVLTSQEKIILRILELNKGSDEPMVFEEGLAKIRTPDGKAQRVQWAKDPEAAASIKREIGFTILEVWDAFPGGVPKKPVSEWTELQKTILISHGASFLLWELGEIRYVYPAEDVGLNKLSVKTREKYDGRKTLNRQEIAEYTQNVRTNREIEAITRIIKQANENETPKNIVLIFGKSHNFEQYQVPKLTWHRVDTDK